MKRPTPFLALFILLLLCSQGLMAQTTISNPSNCNLNIQLTDNSCPEDLMFGDNPDIIDIVVNNAVGTQLGVDVYLKEVRMLIEHSWVGDLELELVTPSGKSLNLLSDVGGGDDNLGDPTVSGCGGAMVLSADACVSITEGLAPFDDQAYRPIGNFYQLDDGSNPNGTWQLRVCDDVIEDAGILQYFELVFETLVCEPLQNVRVVNVDTTTTILNWDVDAGCGPVIIEYGPTGFTPGNDGNPGGGTVVMIDACPPYALQGLAPETSYDIYLRSFCDGDGTYSINSCPLSIETGCLPPPVSISSDFDDQTSCGTICGLDCDITGVWENNRDDDFDWLVRSGATPTSSTGPSTDVSGSGNYLYIESSGNECTTGSEAHLLSNCIQIDKKGTDLCHLSFNYHMFGFGAGTLRLEASEDGGITWLTLWTRSGNQGNQWFKEYINLNEYENGDVVQFRWVGIKGVGSRGDMAIDELEFYGSIDLGDADQFFYADKDGDGFGDPNDFLTICASLAPDGYVTNDLDCNDSDTLINPNATEITCNGIDENCNGMEDDAALLPPIGQNDTICSGEQAVISATAQGGNLILWYGSPDGNDIAGPIGNMLSPSLPANNGPDPEVYTFYAEEFGLGCRSTSRTAVQIVIFPNPNLSLEGEVGTCEGQVFNLASLNIVDNNFTAGQLYFGDTFGFDTSEALMNTFVDPQVQATWYYQMLTEAGCSDEGSINILQTDAFQLSFSPADSFGLCQGSSQTIEVSVVNGFGDYDYVWENGVQVSTVTIDAPDMNGATDSISVSVTDAGGCKTSGTVKFTNTNTIPGISRAVQPVSACGLEDGVITITPVSGDPPYQYSWRSTTGVTGDSLVMENIFQLNDLRQGTYDITLTDPDNDECEFVIRSIFVNGPAAVLMEPVIEDVSCLGADDGSITLQADLGSNPSYLWSTGDTTSSITSLTSGMYDVTVTEGSCETILEGLEVSEPEELRVVFRATNPLCFDTNDGQAEALVFGGNPDYTFQWSSGGNDAIAADLSRGWHVLTVTDNNSCQYVDSVFLRTPGELRIFRDSLKNIDCFGETNGYIQISTVGGLGPYRYEWSNGLRTPIATQLPKGNYTISVTDFNNCVETADFIITEPDLIDLGLEEIQQPICVGDETGEITLDVSGGTFPYRYNWTNGQTDSIATNLGVGAYTVIVSDRSGCFADSLTVVLNAESVLDLTVQIEEPSCEGPDDGRIVLVPALVGDYEFTWQDASQDSILSDIPIGNYSVSITDFNGCNYDTMIQVIANQPIDVAFDIRQPSCFDQEDGLITLNVSGAGIPPFEYEWNDGFSDRNRTGLGAASYVITITDDNECVYVSDSIVLSYPKELVEKVIDVGSIKCRGEQTAFIEIDAEGGTFPYDYLWLDNNTTEQNRIDIGAGLYTVVISDANDCTVETQINIEEPPQLEVAIDLLLGEICSGDSSNVLDALVDGGVGPYEYFWSNRSTSKTLVNVPSNDYSVLVTDANRCQVASPSVKVRDGSEQLQLDSFFVTEVSCRGLEDGTMTAQISGGRAPYSYHFSNNHKLTTTDISVTCVDLPVSRGYQVTITDRNGCITTSDRVPLSEPQLLTVNVREVNDVKCFQGSDGAITVNVAGGTAPYFYSWRDSVGNLLSNLTSLTNVPIGKYDLQIVDERGCTSLLEDIIVDGKDNPVRLVDSLTVISDVKCLGAADGSIDVTLVGGKPPFTFSWNNGSNVQDPFNLEAGTYRLTVTDDDTCASILPPIIVSAPLTSLEAEVIGLDVSCFSSQDGSASANLAGGTAPYALFWENSQQQIFSDDNAVSNLTAGDYFLIVEDDIGCRKRFGFNINEPNPLEVEIIQVPPIAPDTPLRLFADASGGTPLYNYLWNTGQNSAEIITTEEFDFAVTVSDANNCTTSDSLFLVSVVDQSLVSSAKVFPNPAIHQVTLSMDLTTPTELQLELRDVTGALMMRQALGKIKQLRHAINVDNLAGGLYWIQVFSDKREAIGNWPVLIGDR
ncbi:MAG: T9SS type A sorting domain-containing protein [Bacteroidota bacterium]